MVTSCAYTVFEFAYSLFPSTVDSSVGLGPFHYHLYVCVYVHACWCVHVCVTLLMVTGCENPSKAHCMFVKGTAHKSSLPLPIKRYVCMADTIFNVSIIYLFSCHFSWSVLWWQQAQKADLHDTNDIPRYFYILHLCFLDTLASKTMKCKYRLFTIQLLDTCSHSARRENVFQSLAFSLIQWSVPAKTFKQSK